MASFSRLDEIKAWTEARDQAVAVLTTTNAGGLARDFALRDQIRRAAVSIAANIAEGFGRGGTNEFARFLDIARGSAYELDTLLSIVRQAKLLDEEAYNSLIRSNRAITAKIAGLTAYLRADLRAHDGLTANREPRTANQAQRKGRR